MNRLTMCTATFFLILSTSVAAQSPVLPIQGTLREMAGNLVNDTRSVTFRLYGEDSGGTAFYTVTKDVSFTNGQFVVYLGDQGDLALNPEDFEGLPQVWLGIEVSPETVEMTPRVRLGTSPFALYAAICGEAQAAATANNLACSGCVSFNELDSSTRAQIDAPADDLACSGCVSFNELDSSTRAQIDAPADDVACSGCVDGSDLDATDFLITEYSIGPITGNETCTTGPSDALFCALTRTVRRNILNNVQTTDPYCSVVHDDPGWRVCARGANHQTVACKMTCLSLR